MAHILLADDDVEQLSVHRKLLEALGHKVGTSGSPGETLRELEMRRPDLIVVDLHFPLVEDCLSVIRGIRETGCQLPLIVLSGWPDDLYGTPEERLVSRVVIKGSIHELLRTIAELVG